MEPPSNVVIAHPMTPKLRFNRVASRYAFLPPHPPLSPTLRAVERGQIVTAQKSPGTAGTYCRYFTQN